MSFKCSCTVVCFFTVMLGLSRFVTLEEIPVCRENTGFTAQSCCPCYRDEICSVECPGDYLTITPTSTVSCDANSTAPATGTTPPSTASENTTQLSSSVNVTDDNDVIIGVVCLMSCPVHRYYDNSTKQCLECDDTCLECAWPDRKNCTVCNFLYNDTCYSRCPENTVESSNVTQDGAKLCETKLPHDETKEELPIAAIAGVASGVVVIIIIIILVYCCRRRGELNTGSTERRAMSVILGEQQSTDRNGKVDASKRRNYENTSTALPQPIDIEQQGDKVLRYTRDPTFKDTNIKDEPKSDDTDSIYTNEAMIRLAANCDLSQVKDSELNDKLEIEEIGVAPSAPVDKPADTTTNRHAPRPVPTSAKQKLPQPVATASKQKKRKNTVKAQPDVHEPGDYLYMSHVPSDTAVDAEPAADIDSGLEDYENFSFSEIPQGRLGKQASAHQKTSPEDGTEIYTNTPGNPEGDHSDLEDYENTKEFRKHSERPKEEASEDLEKASDYLEDYENMKDMDVYENYTSPQVHKK